MCSFRVSSAILSLRGGAAEFDALTKFSPSVVFEKSAEFINFAGGSLLLVATTIAIIDLIMLAISSLLGTQRKCLFRTGKNSVDSIRYSLGSMVNVGLEILVAADVIDTLTKPAHSYKLETLYKIGMVVIIRTTLAYFLNQEMENIEKKMHHEKLNV